MGLLLPALRAGAITYTMYLWMQPPARAASSSSHTDKANLTNLWHSSSLEQTSRALDWNDGTPAAGETAWFRGYGVYNLQGTSIQARGEPTESLSNCGQGSVHWVRVAIRDVSTGLVKGYMSYQHITLSSTLTFGIIFNNTPAGYFNNRALGTMVK